MAKKVTTVVEPKNVWLKNWFYNKQFSEGYFSNDYAQHKCNVIKETDKAYYVSVVWSQRFDVIWTPKSCVFEKEEDFLEEVKTAEQKQAEFEAKRNAKFEEACRKYQELIAYAKSLGIKGVREGLRRDTIVNKIQKAGYEIPA